ncbi:hypothetical protein TELCIR_11217 [Teladorsagia circumcincta]|uniref:Uncharacterized protein n=1 Tax=Teladorsagia circumcincta TaxID=45464 RepID=A0A2G9UA21_TELCI|nr:hypothetical protein TELCIR_11217 [Teladorsagia circumcincta]
MSEGKTTATIEIDVSTEAKSKKPAKLADSLKSSKKKKEADTPVSKEAATPVSKEAATPVSKEAATPVSKEAVTSVSKESLPKTSKETPSPSPVRKAAEVRASASTSKSALKSVKEPTKKTGIEPSAELMTPTQIDIDSHRDKDDFKDVEIRTKPVFGRRSKFKHIPGMC